MNLAIIGKKKAARGTKRKVVVNGLVALVSAIVLKNTAQLPRPPQSTMSQWKKTSKK